VLQVTSRGRSRIAISSRDEIARIAASFSPSDRYPVVPGRVQKISLGLAPHSAPKTIVSPSGAKRDDSTRPTRYVSRW